MSNNEINQKKSGADENFQKKEAFAELAYSVCEFCYPEYPVEIVWNKDKSQMGLALWEEGAAAAFTIWLNPLYQKYKEGSSLYSVFSELQAACQNIILPKETLADFVADFGLVMPRICYRLVNRYRDKEFLKTVPYVPWLDLAIEFYILVSVKDGKENSVLIDNSLMEKWGFKDTEELYAIASKNMQKVFPGSIRPMEEILASFEKDKEGEAGEVEKRHNRMWADVGVGQLYIATNKEMLNGAGVVLYDGLLRSFAESVGKDLYLIPSSVHEMVIAVEGEKEGEKERLKEIVQEANWGLVDGKEVLSNKIYRYDRMADKVGIV